MSVDRCRIHERPPNFFLHTNIARTYVYIHAYAPRTLHSYSHPHNPTDIFTFQAPPTNGRYIYCYQILPQAIDFVDRVVQRSIVAFQPLIIWQ